MSVVSADEAQRPTEMARTGGDPAGWFEVLYAAAARGRAQIPWDHSAPHPLLTEWARIREVNGSGQRAIVVGSGLGYDAEYIAGLGYETTGFDISASAVAAAHSRFPDSQVTYLTADLLNLPDSLRGGFDLVVEIMTVQSLPDPPRQAAIAAVASLPGPGGTLIVIAMGADETDRQADRPPWPLIRPEIEAFATAGLRQVRIDDIRATGSARRWRAEFSRPAD